MKTRDRIIQASIELFNEHGERPMTTNHIAAHLGISPGNLYYHFRSKNDIIHHIFAEYQQQLEGMVPNLDPNLDTITYLKTTFDGIFALMWRFSFFYSNLPDILSRDDKLREAYLDVQIRQAQHLVNVVNMLKNAGVLTIPQEDIADFVNALKMTGTFWISYIKTQPVITSCEENVAKIEKPEAGGKIDKAMVYKGVGAVLLVLKPYLSLEDQQGILTLQRHYNDLAAHH